MAETIYQSKHTGQYINEQIGKVPGINTRVSKLERSLQDKADIKIVPTSITQLEPDASLVYVGKSQPTEDKYTIWVRIFENSSTPRVYAKGEGGEWVDTTPSSQIKMIEFNDEDIGDAFSELSVELLCGNFMRDDRPILYLPFDYARQLLFYPYETSSGFSKIVFATPVTKDNCILYLTGENFSDSGDVWTLETVPVSAGNSGENQEIYIGTGDIPEGYVLQIDPDGDDSIDFDDLKKRVTKNETDIKELQENGSSGGLEIFEIQWNGTTGNKTYAEVSQAIAERKIPVLYRGDKCIAIFSGFVEDHVVFLETNIYAGQAIVEYICNYDNSWEWHALHIALSQDISADNETFKTAVLNCFPDADTMSFPREETVSEVSEE